MGLYFPPHFLVWVAASFVAFPRLEILTGLICVPQILLQDDLLMGEILIGEISRDGYHVIVGDANICFMLDEDTGRSFLRRGASALEVIDGRTPKTFTVRIPKAPGDWAPKRASDSAGGRALKDGQTPETIGELALMDDSGQAPVNRRR